VSAGFTRRSALLSVGAAVAAGCAGARREEVHLLELLERKVGGRLGVFMLDTATGLAEAHRGAEPFGMCSTFKLPLAGVVLREADAGRLDLAERLTFTQADMVPYAPVTTQNLAQGWMTVEALAEAAQKTSDNVAANLLIKRLGGPEGVTSKVQAIYRHGFRLDRYETQMNFVPPGEVRDTATPEGMGLILSRLLSQDETTTSRLAPASRAKLIQWMVDTTTGMKRIRAGLPP